MTQYGASGFQAIDVLIEDNYGNSPSQSEQWAVMAGMQTVAVLADSNYATWSQYEQDFYIPTIVHLGPDMTVLSIDQGITDPGYFIP